MADTTDTAGGADPPWLTREQAAARLQVSVDTIDRGIADGSLPYKRLGRTVRIFVDALDAWERQPGGAT